MRSTTLTMIGTALMMVLALAACSENAVDPRPQQAGVQPAVKLSVKEVTLTSTVTTQTVRIEPTVDERVSWRIRVVGANVQVTPNEGTGPATVTVRAIGGPSSERRTRLGELQVDLDGTSRGGSIPAKKLPGSAMWFPVADATVAVWYTAS